MNTPQELSHPGPRADARFAALPCRAQPVQLRLPAGVPFDQAVAQAFDTAGYSAGYLTVPTARFLRLTYVIPDRAPGDGRAAWYSDTRVLENADATQIGLHLGRRDGAPFLHCHGLWGLATEPLRMGHLLAPDSVLATPVTASGWGLTGARLEVQPDPETGFDLFTPVPDGPAGAGSAALLCTLRPNTDPHKVLPQIAQGMTRARVEGIGSLVNTEFDGRFLDSYATEVLLHPSRIAAGQAQLHAASVGFDGIPVTGILRPHRNRICITAELLLMDDDAPSAA